MQAMCKDSVQPSTPSQSAGSQTSSSTVSAVGVQYGTREQVSLKAALLLFLTLQLSLQLYLFLDLTDPAAVQPWGTAQSRNVDVGRHAATACW